MSIHKSYTIAIDKIDFIEGNSREIEGIKYVIGKSFPKNITGKILSSPSGKA